MNESFVKARSKLILDNPFFGTLCLRLKPVEWEQPTGAVDGVHLYYNPKWFEGLTSMERVGFLAHEVMHVVLLHITRRQEREPEKWNIACDYAINNYIHDVLRQPLPEGGLIDVQKYGKDSAEKIYSTLMNDDEALNDLIDQDSDSEDSDEQQDQEGEQDEHGLRSDRPPE